MKLTDSDKAKLINAKEPLEKLLETRVEELVNTARNTDPSPKRDYLLDFANELEGYFLNILDQLNKEPEKSNKDRNV